jgi:hypothetical protein
MTTGSEAGPVRPVFPGDASSQMRPGGPARSGRAPTGRTAPPGIGAEAGPAAGLLMVLAGITLGVASYLHRQGHIPLAFTEIRGESFYAASIPEAVIALVLVAGAVVYLAASPAARAAAGRGQGRRVALAATTFAIIGVAYGMSVTIGDGRVPDIVYHSCLMAVLLITGALLLRRGSAPARRQQR